MLQIEGIELQPEEVRAATNMHQFITSLRIMTSRLRQHLSAYRSDSWVDVPYDELFLDTQALFLFVQQFLEDLALLVRMSYPDGERQQMPRKFTALMERIIDQTQPDHIFRRFLQEEQQWFAELKDTRDDLLHRTAFDRKRSTQFPHMGDLLRAGGGRTEFLSAPDLRSYVAGVIDRVLALACLADDFTFSKLAERFGRDVERPPAIIVQHGAIDFENTNESEPGFPVGTVFMSVGGELFENLDYFN